MDHKKLGLFRIKYIKGPLNFKLELLRTINIYLVFYISLLKLVPLGALKAPKTEIDLVNLDIKYNIKEILNYKIIRNQIKYLIR